MDTNCEDEGFNLLLLFAQREAVLPTGAVLSVALEARRVLVLDRADAGAAVGIALPVRQRKPLQVDVRRRIRMRRRRRLRFLRLGHSRLLARRSTGRGADRRRGASGDQQRQEHARAASGNRQQGEGRRKLKRVKFYTMGGHGSVRFVHLRLHSEYSIVDGMVRVDDAVDAAAADGMPALALTDLSNVFGIVKFYVGARSRGVKPIIGCDAWLTHDS